MKLNDKHLAYYASCDDAPDKDGWLWKKGELNTSYQKRWCVLRGNLFFYFEKRQDKEPIGVIVLENCSVQLAEGGDSPFTFSIQFGGEGTRVYKLTAENDDECTLWVKALSNSSFRHLEIMVEALQREFELLNAKHNNGDKDISRNSTPAMPMSFADSHFSLNYKSNSVNNLSDLGNDDQEDNDDFLSYSASSEDLSIGSPKLSRSHSSHELSFKAGKMDQLKPKSKGIKKLSPRLIRKNKQKQKENERTKTPPIPQHRFSDGRIDDALDEKFHIFLKMHERFYRQIQEFCQVESTL